jgi:hypothetical protein
MHISCSSFGTELPQVPGGEADGGWARVAARDGGLGVGEK